MGSRFRKQEEVYLFERWFQGARLRLWTEQDKEGRSIPHQGVIPEVSAMDCRDWIVQEHTECLPEVSEERAVGRLSIGSCLPFSRCPLPSELQMCSELVKPPKPHCSWHQRIPGKWRHCQLTMSRNVQGNFHHGHSWKQKNGWAGYDSAHRLCLL